MNRLRHLTIALIFAVTLALMLGSWITIARAQGDTPTPTAEEMVTNTPLATEVVIVPATEEPNPVVEPTTVPIPDNPRGSLTLADVLPYVVPVLIILGLAFFAFLGFLVDRLWKSVPSTLKPIIYPMLESGVHAGLDALDTYVQGTPSKTDDNLAAELRAEFDAKLKALNDEMQAQRVADAKKQVESIQIALQNGRVVG